MSGRSSSVALVAPSTDVAVILPSPPPSLRFEYSRTRGPEMILRIGLRELLVASAVGTVLLGGWHVTQWQKRRRLAKEDRKKAKAKQWETFVSRQTQDEVSDLGRLAVAESLIVFSSNGLLSFVAEAQGVRLGLLQRCASSGRCGQFCIFQAAAGLARSWIRN
jgi:hypothetical protein